MGIMANQPLARPDSGGLTQDEAGARLAADGPNELPSSKPRGIVGIALEVVREPMFLLLIACGALYLVMGDVRDALLLLGFVVVVMVITFLQQRRTERALDALRDLSSPRALVWRDGAPVRIPGREVVRGDLLMIAEGDRVPADAVLLAGSSVSVDESLLTGESVPVGKVPMPDAPTVMGKPGGEDAPYLFSGSMVVRGKGTARVLATGVSTALGDVGRALSRVGEEPSRVQRDTRRVVRWVAIGGITLSVCIAVVYGVTRGDWLNGLLVGITTAMALVPEELPVVLTVFLGLGAWRIAQKHVLTRRIPAIEMLGAATVLCTDKTGTLTENRMSLASLWTDGAAFPVASGMREPLPERYHALLEFATLAGHRDPFDPMEQAIVAASDGLLAGSEHLHPEWRLVMEYPLSPELKAMSRVWTSATDDRYVIASKGAPEDIVDLCHVAPGTAAVISAAAQDLASRGLRVLGVAHAYFAGTTLPGIQHDFAFEFAGLVALADPLRNGVPAAVGEARSAGVRIIMITGDYPPTAMSIAAQAAIDCSAGYLTGTDLDCVDDAQLRDKVRSVNVFCRVVPEQKLRLVVALKANGETVAMTGDGVNDAPALKAAHIGIAMGHRGTDVARESAALVLLDDSFMAIIEAIRLGRRIFDNLRKAVTFIVGIHVPIVGMSFVPVVLGWPIMLMPIHVMFLQLIIDPVCSVVFEAEPEDAGTMLRAPRRADESMFGAGSVLLGLLQGAVLLLAVMSIDWIARTRGLDAGAARALTFTTLVLGALALVFANRSLTGGVWRMLLAGNAALWPIAVGTLGVLAFVLYLPVLGSAFHFSSVGVRDLAPAVAAVALCALSFGVLKHASMSRAHA